MLKINQEALEAYMVSVDELKEKYKALQAINNGHKDKIKDLLSQVSRLNTECSTKSLLIEELWNTVKEVEAKLTPDASKYYNAQLKAGIDLKA